MNEPLNILRSNFPHGDEFLNDSFVGLLHEDQVWNESKYWEFDRAVYHLSNQSEDRQIAREIAWPLMKIFSYVMGAITAHHNKNDLYSITIDDSALHDFRERIQVVIEGFFQNKMPNNEHFEKINPLL